RRSLRSHHSVKPRRSETYEVTVLADKAVSESLNSSSRHAVTSVMVERPAQLCMDDVEVIHAKSAYSSMTSNHPPASPSHPFLSRRASDIAARARSHSHERAADSTF
ncbi:MAG: hypothetical protein ACI8V4_002415, partial [Ilumatobacter sp.]